ncbi:hypothetical protein AB0C02_21140 [Micromonospora sp. NPDC048999]|uniref:hypothetical protein n=1 Tax=Micromonospora sp. NPDC048999 TaxID=3155391 RepID=UPI0033F0EEFD
MAETGRRWRLPAPPTGYDNYPAISRDGRRIGYLRGDHGPYVIHDLVTGTRTEITAVGGRGGPSITTPYVVEEQSPSFWSPDGRWLAQHGVQRDEPWGAVVLGVDGSVTFVRNGEGDGYKGFLAGWVNTDELLWVKMSRSGDTPSVPDLVATVTGLDGQPRRTITLNRSSPWLGESFAGQWTATVSPDGRELLIVEQDDFAGIVRRFSLLDGHETAGPAAVPDLNMPCAAGWAGSTPAVPIYDDVATTAVLRDGEPRTLVAVEPEVGAKCFLWAADALSGKAHGGLLLGTSTAWWTWWLREAAAASLLVGGGGWAVRRWRRSRRQVAAPRVNEPGAATT